MNKEKIIEINKLLKSLDDDSKRVSQDSRNRLNEIAIEHFKTIHNISNNINIYIQRYNEIDNIYFDFKEKNILYFNIYYKNNDNSDQKTISIEDLSDFDYKKFEEDTKQQRIIYLKKVIDSHKKEIIKCEEQLEQLLK